MLRRALSGDCIVEDQAAHPEGYYKACWEEQEGAGHYKVEKVHIQVKYKDGQPDPASRLKLLGSC